MPCLSEADKEYALFAEIDVGLGRPILFELPATGKKSAQDARNSCAAWPAEDFRQRY
jgi:hypothetical protein